MSLRLIREIHAILLRGGRGANKMPGEFRRTQNWIGGSRPGNAAFVPPPPERLMECLDSFERFLHDDKHKLPVLVEAGLAHVQFECVHPFSRWQWPTRKVAHYASATPREWPFPIPLSCLCLSQTTSTFVPRCPLPPVPQSQFPRQRMPANLPKPPRSELAAINRSTDLDAI
jgi:hypothetical protein